MKFDVDDSVVLNKDYLDLSEGTAGTVERVNHVLQNYWVLFDGKTETVLTEEEDIDKL